MIIRAFKGSATDDELKMLVKIARQADVHAIEIQEVPSFMRLKNIRERVKAVSGALKPLKVTHLAYHFPIRSVWNDLEDAKRFDLASEYGGSALKLVEETMTEAAMVGTALEIENEIPVIVHLLGFAEKVTFEGKMHALRAGEDMLKRLVNIANLQSNRYGLISRGRPLLKITRENNPPSHGSVQGMIDFNPNETRRLSAIGVRTNLDFAHIWQYMLYLKGGTGEFPAIEWDKLLYNDTLELEQAVRLLESSLSIIHMNDASGCLKEGEGLEVGLGSFPHKQAITLLHERIRNNLIGTYEIKNGHVDWMTQIRSDTYYRKLFGKKFNEIFV